MLELEGRLVFSDRTRYLLLTVPNSIAIGAFQALNIPGIEIPTWEGDIKFNAHITVMRPDEIESIGGHVKLNERGKKFKYRIEGIDVADSNSGKYSRYFYYKVVSPELAQLRRSYGLSGVPTVPFHITFAARRRNVLRENTIRKAAFYGPISEIAARPMRIHWSS